VKSRHQFEICAEYQASWIIGARSMKPILRPYQQASIDALYDYFRTRDGNPLIVLPTGAGK